mgnify:CR=1 FL=1
MGLGTIARKLFGTANDRKVKSVRPLVAQINALEPEFEALSDEGIKQKTEALAMSRADATGARPRAPRARPPRPPRREGPACMASSPFHL